MATKSTFKKIWDIVSTVIVVIVVICAVFLMGARVLGYNAYSVLSGSMEPTYSAGDLIYVKKVDPSTITEGTVITFMLDESKAIGTHRVVRVDAENKHLYTKGDANDTPDSNPVHFNNVVGVPKFSIPMLGYVSNFISNIVAENPFVLIAAGILLIIIVFLPDIIGLFKKKPQQQPDVQQPAEEVYNNVERTPEQLKEKLNKTEEEQK